MGDLELSNPAQQWVIVVLVWIGFGTLAGLLARALLPGREPGGAVGTVFIGIVGSALGPLLLTIFWQQDNFNPISPIGLLSAVGAAFVLLAGYRLIAVALFARTEEE